MEQAKFEILKDAAGSGSASRTVTYALMVTAVVVAISFWNALSESWNKSRLALCANEIRWYEYLIADSLPPECVRNSNLLKDFNGAQLAFNMNPCSKDVLEHQLKAMHSSRISNVLSIKVPFFNTTIDINDLTLYAGLAFVILLALLRQTLVLRANYLATAKKVLIEDALDDQRKRELFFGQTYILMKQDVMYQELTRGSLIGYLSKASYGFPLALLITLLIYDIVTIDIGNMLNENDTLIVLALGSCLVVVNLIFTFEVFKTLNRIDNTIKEYTGIQH